MSVSFTTMGSAAGNTHDCCITCDACGLGCTVRGQKTRAHALSMVDSTTKIEWWIEVLLPRNGKNMNLCRVCADAIVRVANARKHP